MCGSSVWFQLGMTHLTCGFNLWFQLDRQPMCGSNVWFQCVGSNVLVQMCGPSSTGLSQVWVYDYSRSQGRCVGIQTHDWAQAGRASCVCSSCFRCCGVLSSLDTIGHRHTLGHKLEVDIFVFKCLVPFVSSCTTTSYVSTRKGSHQCPVLIMVAPCRACRAA